MPSDGATHPALAACSQLDAAQLDVDAFVAINDALDHPLVQVLLLQHTKHACKTTLTSFIKFGWFCKTHRIYRASPPLNTNEDEPGQPANRDREGGNADMYKVNYISTQDIRSESCILLKLLCVCLLTVLSSNY